MTSFLYKIYRLNNSPSSYATLLKYFVLNSFYLKFWLNINGFFRKVKLIYVFIPIIYTRMGFGWVGPVWGIGGGSEFACLARLKYRSLHHAVILSMQIRRLLDDREVFVWAIKLDGKHIKHILADRSANFSNNLDLRFGHCWIMELYDLPNSIL